MNASGHSVALGPAEPMDLPDARARTGSRPEPLAQSTAPEACGRLQAADQPDGGIAHVAGVGPALSKRLVTHFGTAGLEEAIARQDVGAIAAVEGVGPKRARRIILEAQGAPDPASFLATDPAGRLWDDIVARAQAYCGTAAGRDRVALRRLATTPREAQEAAASVMAWVERIQDWDHEAVRAGLARLRTLSAPRPARSLECTVVCDPDTMERLEAQGIDRWVGLSGPEALRHPEGLVLVVGDIKTEGADEAPGAVPMASNAGALELAPESVLAWFRHNRSALEALDAVRVATGQEPLAQSALDALPGPPAKSVDLAHAVEEERVRLQASVRERINALSVTGADLLATFDDHLPRPVLQVVREEIDAAHGRLRETAGLHVPVFVPGRPVTVDEEALQQARHAHEGQTLQKRHQELVTAARRLAPLQERVQAAHQEILDWEPAFAWAALATELELTPAMWGESLALQGALHLDLPRTGSQRISYLLGGDAPVALLTGANSGGKTTLLECIAQCMLLARFGLPVPATSAVLPWVDSLHLLTHGRSMDAGAFESFLRRFLPLAETGPRRMVLADEVEAITELQAAARIIGFFLQRLAAHGHLGLFVTHMAPLLLESGAAVRVDGIQSSGLDADGHLIVDRVPRMGFLATSTPELIIERIARSDPDGPWQELLAAVRRGVTPK